jgi:type I restriction enzyme S subunit
MKSNRVPRLRFPEFRGTGEWESKKLSSLIQLISGVHLSPDQYKNSGTNPYFTGPSDFTNKVHNVSKWIEESTSMAGENDILITVKGSGVGEIFFLALQNVAIGRQLMAIHTKHGLSRFIYQFLLTKRTRFEDLASGNLIPGLSRGDILNLEVQFSSLPEQQKIADCLASLDELTTLEAQKLDRLKTHKKGLQQLFPAEGETLPKLRFPEFRDTGEWEFRELINLTPTNEKYGIVDGPFGSNLKTIHYKKEGIPIITSGFVTEGYFYAEKYDYVTPDKFEKEKRSGVKGGDIVMAKIGARCGTSAIMPPYHKQGILSGNALKITIDEIRFSAMFVWQQLWFLYKIGNLDGLIKVGAQPAISISNLKKFEIAMPREKAEQQKIADCLASLDDLITAQTQQLAALKTHKKGLMQQLFPNTHTESTP